MDDAGCRCRQPRKLPLELEPLLNETFRLFSPGDVLGDARHPIHHAGGIANGKRAVVNPTLFTIGADDAVFDVVAVRPYLAPPRPW